MGHESVTGKSVPAPFRDDHRAVMLIGAFLRGREPAFFLKLVRTGEVTLTADEVDALCAASNLGRKLDYEFVEMLCLSAGLTDQRGIAAWRLWRGSDDGKGGAA